MRESETQRERTEKFALVMPVQVGLDGSWQKVPPRLCEFLGYTHEELIGSNCSDVTHAMDQPEDRRQIGLLLSGEIRSFDREKRYIHKDGRTVWAYINCSVVTDRDGQPIHFLTYIRDITARVQAERALRDSEEQYRTLIQNSPVCIHSIDREGRVISMNSAGLRMIEVQSVDEVMGQSYLELVERSDRQRVSDLMQLALEGEAVAFEFCAIVNGQHRILSSKMIPLFDNEGSISQLMGVTEEITRRVDAERKLRESEQRFRTIFEQAAVGVALIDTNSGRFVRVNRKYEQLIGYSSAELLDLTFMDITSEGLEDDLNNMQKLRDGVISEFNMDKDRRKN